MIRSAIRCCATQIKTENQLKNITLNKEFNVKNVIQLNQVKIRKGGVREMNNSKKFNVSSIGLLPIPIISFYLGYWQINRMQWKKELIESLKAQGKSADLRDEHFNYALTWFSISAITLVIWIKQFLL